MTHAPKPARLVLASLTAVSMSSALLVFGASPATAAPEDPDVTGTVVNASGVGLPGVYVTAYTTPSDGSAARNVASAETDGTGTYVLEDLDPASLADDFSDPAITSETEFRLYFRWYGSTPADLHSTGYLSRGLGGSKSPRAAGSVVVPAGGVATAPTQALPAAGGVLLKVVGPTGAPVTGGDGTLYEPGAANPFTAGHAYASTGTDDAFYPDGPDAGTDPDAPLDGLVYIRAVEPDAYAVEASGSDFNQATSSQRRYLSRFFGKDGSYAGATPVTVKPGAFTPVTIQLTDKMTPLEEPRIIGNSSVGSKLRADPGTWLGEGGGSMFAIKAADTDYTYQWLRGSKQVGTGPTYKVTKKDKKDKIRLVVTAYRGDFVGTASSDPTSKVGEKSRVTAKRLPSGDVAVTVVVAKKKLADKLGTPRGKVVLMTKDGEMASKKVKLDKAGKAVLSAKKTFAGEKLVVLYLGGGKLGSDTGTVKG